MTDIFYIYSKQAEVGDGCYNCPEVVGIWDDKYELMKYINKYRKEKWYELVRERISFREELTDSNYDYGIYRDYDPQLYITEILKNSGHWLIYDDLVNHSGQDGQWYTYPQKIFFDMNNEELWTPSFEEQNNVKMDIEIKKKKNTDKEDRTRFINLFKKFKEQGNIDEILESIEKQNE